MRQTTLRWLLCVGLLLALGLLPEAAVAKWRKGQLIGYNETRVCRDGIRLEMANFYASFEDPPPPPSQPSQTAPDTGARLYENKEVAPPTIKEPVAADLYGATVLLRKTDLSIPAQNNLQTIVIEPSDDDFSSEVSTTIKTYYYTTFEWRWDANRILDVGDQLLITRIEASEEQALFPLTVADCFFVAPPKITGEPVDVTINSGQSTSLSVQAAGSSLKYQWYEGEKGNTAKKVGSDSKDFTTPNLTQSKRYWVRVSNSAGTVDSRTVTVRVITPPSISQQPADVTITSGQTATLSVAAGGTTPLEYDWYEGERGNTGKLVGSGLSSFTTPPLTQTTRFWVRVRNPAASINSRTVTVTVITPPSISQQPADLAISSGQTATLRVVVAGTQPLSFQWYEGESGDTSQPVAGATGAGLTTPPLTQTTRYWLRASNTAGAVDSRTATVTVTSEAPPLTPPQIASQPDIVVVTGVGSVTLSVVVTGTQPLSFQWYEGEAGDTSRPVAGAGAASLTTPALLRTTYYWLRVSNAAGTVDSRTITVAVEAIDRVPGSYLPLIIR